MHTSKLIQLLKLFTTDELRRFAKFIKSPYHNSNPRLEQLFRLLRPHYPDFEHSKLEKTKMFSKLFPKKKYQDASMRKLLSAMVEKVETFLAVEKIEQNRFLKKKLFAQSMGKRGAFIPFQQIIEALIIEIKEQPIRDIHYYLEQFHLNFELYFHPQYFKRQPNNLYLNEMLQHLDSFFILAKLQLSCEVYSRQQFINEDLVKISFLEEINSNYLKKEIPNQPILSLYLNLLLLQQPINTDYLLEQTLTLYQENLALLSPSEKIGIFTFLLNYLNQLLTSGNAVFLNMQLDLYKLALKEHLFIEKDSIHFAHFLNVVTSASVLGETVWVNNFLKKFKSYLDPKSRKEILALSNVYIAFGQGLFFECFQQLQELSTYPSALELRVRVLHIQVLYEIFLLDISYQSTLEYKIEAFEKYLYRLKSHIDSRKVAFNYFCKAVKLLIIDFLESENTNASQAFIATKTPLVAKIWLLKKCTREV